MVDDWTILSQTYDLRGDYKHFSTKEAAQEYILVNKKSLSIKDLRDLSVHQNGDELTLHISTIKKHLINKK